MSLMVRGTSSRVVCTVSVLEGLCALGCPLSCSIRPTGWYERQFQGRKGVVRRCGQKLKRRETGCGEGSEEATKRWVPSRRKLKVCSLQARAGNGLLSAMATPGKAFCGCLSFHFACGSTCQWKRQAGAATPVHTQTPKGPCACSNTHQPW